MIISFLAFILSLAAAGIVGAAFGATVVKFTNRQIGGLEKRYADLKADAAAKGITRPVVPELKIQGPK